MEIANPKLLEKQVIAVQVKATTQPRVRILSIDIVRGLAMLAMLLVHSAEELSNFSYTTAYRWEDNVAVSMDTAQAWIGFVINFSAPAFFLLMGIGLAFFEVSRRERGWTVKQIDQYAMMRGAILIALDQLLLNWEFVPLRYHIYVGVLTILGLSMWCWVILRRLSTIQLIFLSGVLLLGAETYYYFVGQPQSTSFIRSLLLAPSGLSSEPISVTFPLIPWLSVVIFGYVNGKIFKRDISFSTYTLRVGLLLWGICGFIRLTGGFGNIYTENPLIFTKVPPDLAYLSFYLGATFLLLWAFQSLSLRYESLRNSQVLRVLTLFGQTALFFYILHNEFLLNIVVRILSWLPINSQLVVSFGSAFIVGIILYFLCEKYLFLKRKYPQSILKYL